MFGRTGDKNILSRKVYLYEKDNLTTVFKESLVTQKQLIF